MKIGSSKGDLMTEKVLSESLAEKQSLKQLIVFRVSNEEFGVSIDFVREIIKIGTITPIPDSPKFIKGLINVRGDIVPIMDIKKRLFLPSTSETSKHIVITKYEDNIFGLIVDEVIEVLRVQETDIKPTPQLISKINKEYVSGILTKDNRIIILLDLNKILAEKELSKLMRVAHKKHKNSENNNS